MKVIPAIDLLDGKVVRLKKGDYDQVTVYNNDAVSVARAFAKAGFDHIHVVDLDGARTGFFSNLKSVLKIKDELGLSVQMGGGIRNFGHVASLFEAGVNKIVCSSMAVKNEIHWLKALEVYGGDKCILGMDLKDGKMAYSGWIETMDEPIEEYLQRMEERGLQEVLCTDISRDGMLSGANVELYKQLMTSFPNLHFIASGGVAGLEDLKRLSEADVHAVVVGRAYLEGHLSLNDMKDYHLAKK
jgi:phosphoribosylformimino-5-aminoimidazole carboxamide ribotide isomerase